MGKTSTASKRKYNAKTYKRFIADLKNEDFDKIEKIRNDMNLSRAEFLKMLVDKYLLSDLDGL